MLNFCNGLLISRGIGQGREKAQQYAHMYFTLCRVFILAVTVVFILLVYVFEEIPREFRHSSRIRRKINVGPSEATHFEFPIFERFYSILANKIS